MVNVITIILSFLGVIAQNPYVQKLAVFTFFFGIVSFTVNFFLSKATSNLSDISQILTLASYLGFLNAIKIVLNFVITGFIAKQILAFIRS